MGEVSAWCDQTNAFPQVRSGGLFHVSLFTEDYDAEVKRLKEQCYQVMEVTTAQLFAGFTVILAWLSPEKTKGVWIELVDIASLPENPGQ